jgi:hypothetical protein
MTQQVGFSFNSTTVWAHAVKSLGESGYAWSLNLWNATGSKAMKANYGIESTASASQTTNSITVVTFTITMPSTMAATVQAIAATVTSSVMQEKMNLIKQYVDPAPYVGVQAFAVTSVPLVGPVTCSTIPSHVLTPLAAFFGFIVSANIIAILCHCWYCCWGHTQANSAKENAFAINMEVRDMAFEANEVVGPLSSLPP